MILASFFAITHSSEPNLCFQEGNNCFMITKGVMMD